MGILRKVTSLSTLGAVDYRTPRQKQKLAAAEESKANAKLVKATIKNQRNEAKSQRIEAKAAAEMAKAQAKAASAGSASPQMPPPPSPPLATPQSALIGGGAVDVADQLTKLADLHASGALSDEEFTTLKAKLLA